MHLEHHALIPQCPCFSAPPLLIAVDDHKRIRSAAVHANAGLKGGTCTVRSCSLQMLTLEAAA